MRTPASCRQYCGLLGWGGQAAVAAARTAVAAVAVVACSTGCATWAAAAVAWVAVAAGGCSGPVPGPGLQQSVPASASWLVFELLWRDFFRFITHKYSVQAMGLKEAATAAAPGLLMAA